MEMCWVFVEGCKVGRFIYLFLYWKHETLELYYFKEARSWHQSNSLFNEYDSASVIRAVQRYSVHTRTHTRKCLVLQQRSARGVTDSPPVLP